MRGDGWYTLCVVIAFGFLGTFLLRPQTLDVDVTVFGATSSGGVIEATAVPLSVRRPDGPTSSRQRQDSCVIAAGPCRLTFNWRRGGPILPEPHALELRLRANGHERPLGEVRLDAPRWGDRPAVTCKPPEGCKIV